MELNKEQQKILKRTFLHLMSYGKEVGTFTIEYSYGDSYEGQSEFSTNDYRNTIHCPIPENYSQMCIEIFENYIIDNLSGEDNNSINFTIDTKKRVFDIEINTQIMREDHSGQSYSLDELPDEVKNTLNKLKSENVKSVEARYTGSGDSGGIDDWMIDGEYSSGYADDFGALEDFCYDVLGSNYGGWELNEGSQGTFYFHPFEEEDAVEITHINNYYDNETEQFLETKIE
jgi:hypothetical protein